MEIMNLQTKETILVLETIDDKFNTIGEKFFVNIEKRFTSFEERFAKVEIPNSEKQICGYDLCMWTRSRLMHTNYRSNTTALPMITNDIVIVIVIVPLLLSS